MSLKNRVRSLIASRHGGAVASRLARTAEQYLNAYNNVANWDMRWNGELRVLRRAVALFPGDVIDVGANVGQWVMAVAPFAGDRVIHSFEPVPAIFAELERAVAGLGNVRAVAAGLGRTAATVEINYAPSSSTISSAYPLLWDQDRAERVSCAMLTGDDYLADKGIAAVSVLKIDVEGMEADVLAGFARSFAAGKIAAVQFEHGPAHVHSGHTLKYFDDLFDALGFDVFYIFPRRLKRLRYDLLLEDYKGQNFFAVRRDLAAALSP